MQRIQEREAAARELELRQLGQHLGPGTGARRQPEGAAAPVPHEGVAPVAGEPLHREPVHALEHVGLVELGVERLPDVDQRLRDLGLLLLDLGGAHQELGADEGVVAVAGKKEGAANGRRGTGHEGEHGVGEALVGPERGHRESEAQDGDRRHRELRAPAPRQEDDEPAQEADLGGREALDRAADVAVVPAEEHGQGGGQGGGDVRRALLQARQPADDDARHAGGDLGQVDQGGNPLALGMVDPFEDHRDADQADEEPDG